MKKSESGLLEFKNTFSSEEACTAKLARVRWPGGFECAKCGHRGFYHLKSRPRIFQCACCGKQESVTAGTIFHRTRTPLVKWFWMIYLLARDKRGASAVFLSRELCLRYETAWLMSHKIRNALGEDPGQYLEGVIEVDETYYGGQGPGEKRGRDLSNKNKELIVVAVERVKAHPKQGKGIKKSGYVAGSLRASTLASADAKNLGDFIRANVKSGSSLMTDGFRSYRPLKKDYRHHPTNAGRGRQAGKILPLAHTLFSNFKAWLNGTFHGVRAKHLHRYLNEWTYRTNRRHCLSKIFDSLVARSMNCNAITYRQLVNNQCQPKTEAALTG